jgi:long-chain acyl-CoA synthetase
VALSFLPLCHGFERMVAYIYLTVGISVAFAESIDTIARDLQLVRPTVMSGVPRVFEKLRARIFDKANQAPAPRRALFHWAVSVAMRRGRLLADRRALSVPLRLASAVAERLVFSKIKLGVGGRLRFAVSGSAPLDATLATFFYGAGLPILEGYGLTETAPVLCVMPLEHVRFGTVGPPLPNVDLRIADDGEVLARGPNVMQGYYRRPEETAAVLTDGWFHTGDIGRLDEAGFLCITDRKKELIVTSGGKKVAPQPIEQRLRQQPFVTEAVLVGDRRHFPAALLLPDVAALAATWGVTAAEARARIDSPEARALLQAALDAVNQDLAQFERVKKFAVFAEELTQANGMLTPTLKIKRRDFEERYRSEIDAMYG